MAEESELANTGSTRYRITQAGVLIPRASFFPFCFFKTKQKHNKTFHSKHRVLVPQKNFGPFSFSLTVLHNIYYHPDSQEQVQPEFSLEIVLR